MYNIHSNVMFYRGLACKAEIVLLRLFLPDRTNCSTESWFLYFSEMFLKLEKVNKT